MDPVTVTTAVAPVIGGLVSAVGVCLRRRLPPRLDLRALPPGSRVTVEIGEQRSAAGDE